MLDPSSLNIPDFCMRHIHPAPGPVLVYPVTRKAWDWAAQHAPNRDFWIIEEDAAVEALLTRVEAEGLYVRPF